MNTPDHDDQEPDEESGPICLNCKYWVQYLDGHENPVYGECHRFPPASQRVPALQHPTMFPTIFQWEKNWPRPDADDWCGEHQPMEGVADKLPTMEPSVGFEPTT